ncbi:MAG: winged helix-turn-helix transcriptional regulator [FCB group bacterium]|nr:winged helix-turn-helix transcriptional regulator [FCB group bacterium]MBL7027298.1 winged helix-turn-helix transcriptional regulator [Candidatus Neomarinimicrobiota bacterium]MBL7122268.1 winged helix-turn-helix transcriptional regulator [Candidatus Neomarinimicrobiota bacterium]
MRSTTNVFKALSDTNRLRILMMLKEKSLCVCEMVDILELANSTVSKHLSVLRNANLIMDEKSGRWVNYRIARSEESEDIDFVLTHLEQQLNNEDRVMRDREKLSNVDRFAICAPSVLTVSE